MVPVHATSANLFVLVEYDFHHLSVTCGRVYFIYFMGCREQPPRGAPWVLGLVGHFVQTWPDSECSHTVQCLDCKDLN